MKTKTIKGMIGGLMLLLMAGLWPGLAQAWWNDDWAFRKQIKLDTSKAGADINVEVTDVPVLIRLHTGNFTYFFDMQENAADLRFLAADDATPLKFHVEKFDPLNQMAFIWVKVSKLQAGTSTDSIWMYYGNPEAVAASDVAGTYDIHQAGTYHFAAVEGLPQDQTANANHFSRTTAEQTPASLIGGGLKFNGTAQSVIADSASLKFNTTQGFSFSTWLRLAGAQSDAVLLDRRGGDSELQIVADKTELYARVRTPAGDFITPQVSVTAEAWHHLGLSLGNNRLVLYLDGKEVAAVDAVVSQLAGNIVLGASPEGVRFFNGEMDEVQLSNIARSANDFNVAFQNQGLDARLLAYGGDEQRQTEGGTSYFVVIMQNVTADGWAVILLCVILGIVSWVVMIGKGMTLRRVKKDNVAFLADFNSLGAEDPAKLDHADSEEETVLSQSPVSQALFGKHDHYQSSNIYHVYHRGMQEVNARKGVAVSAAVSPLTSRSLDAIRAGLDAAVVREAQKLNAQMVLLTIAISGGPFLGLLGTVVGVMITFAAIALSGDVNVNAIAPGIAAALLATVAGLAVAIPALFGYNYLGSKIKEATADMHVFVDEFVTRIGEHYGE